MCNIETWKFEISSIKTSKHDRWRIQEIVLYFQRETQKSKIQIIHNATPLTRQCATSRRSRCTRDHARCVPAHLPLLGSCHRTQQDMKWLRVRCQGPRCIPLWRLQPLWCWLGRHSHWVRELQHAVVKRCLPPQRRQQRRRVIQVRHGRVWAYPTCWCFK